MIRFIKIITWVGALFGFYAALQQPLAWYWTRNWVSTSAVVMASDLEYSNSGKSSRSHRAVLSYAYEFNSERFQGHRAMLSEASSNMGLALKTSLLRAPGSVITVYVNPQQPRQSLASRQINWTEVAFGTAFGLIWAGAGWLFTRYRTRFELKAARVDRQPGAEPGRVQPADMTWPIELSGVLLLAALIAAVMSWRGLSQTDQPQLSTYKQRERERVMQANAQLLVKLTPGEVNFELQDSNFAFMALGKGTLQWDGKTLRLAHEELRIMQRADCPSDACRPIRSIQWLLVQPSQLAKPDGAWRVVASSVIQAIRFQAQLRNDQFLQAAQQLELKLQQDFYLRQFHQKQAYLMVQLTAEGDMSTYSRTTKLWGDGDPQASGTTQAVAASAAPSSKSAQSLYAALYYADALATRDHLHAGASVRERYENDTSAAHIAAFSGCAACLEALKEAGADLNDKPSTFRHETPLMMAIRNQQVQAAKKLIELGADPCVTDREGYDAKGWVNFYRFEEKFPFISACTPKR
jgi:hypothetical protein